MADDYKEFIDLANEALEVADEETLESLKEQMYGNIEYLKAISSSFLASVQDTWAKILSLNEAAKEENNIKKSLSKDSKDNPELEEALQKVRNLKINEKEFNHFTQAVFRYQAAVNAVLGQSVKLIYVYRDEDGNPEIWEIDEKGELVVSSMASKGRGLIAKYKTLNALDQHKKQLKNQFNNAEKEQSFETLKDTYKETTKRGDISREVLNKGFLLILWLTDRWHAMKVSAMGDINEAYAAFYLNLIYREDFYFPDSGKEFNVEKFMIDPYYGVGAVDPISGLLQGDVSIKLNNGMSLEFAIKSNNASALSFRQVIDLANAIDKERNTDVITMEWLKAYKLDLTYTHDREGNRKSLIKGRNREVNLAKRIKGTTDKEIKAIEKAILRKK